MVRIALCAGFLCAAWILLGAGQAKADEAPRPAQPSVTVRLGEVAPLVRTAGRRPAATVSAGVRHIARPVRPVRPAKAAARAASDRALPTLRTVLRSDTVARPIRLVTRAVGEVVRVPAAIVPALPTVPRLGPLPSVHAGDLAPRLQPSARPGPSSAAQPQAVASVTSVTSATSSPTTAPSFAQGDVAGFSRAVSARPSLAANARSTAPEPPPAPLLLGSSTDQAASGNGSGTTDFAALAESGAAPRQTSVSCVCSATTAESAPAERPSHRPG